MAEILFLIVINAAMFTSGYALASNRMVRKLKRRPVIYMETQGIYEHPLTTDVSSRFGFCPACLQVYPPNGHVHVCPEGSRDA